MLHEDTVAWWSETFTEVDAEYPDDADHDDVEAEDREPYQCAIRTKVGSESDRRWAVNPIQAGQ